MALEAGTKLGPYEILSSLGAGGMGEVYRAKDTKLDREVAIKVLPADVASSPERLQRFEREAKTVAALNHPNIVTIFAIEESEDHRYIAMELVEGETLDRMIAPGGMPLAKIFDIAIPLADALATAHDKGIVHRDLKPANVMVTRDGRVKVLDFGLAKLTASGQGGSAPDDVTMSAPLTGKGMIIGTVPYMSPEQLKSDLLDHRTDLFSLGVMLYEMATGQRPFKGQKSAEVMSSILRDTPRPLHELNGVLPRHLGRVVARCLKKDSEERYQTAKDVRNELRELRKEVDSGSDFSESQPVSVQTSVSPPQSSTSSTSLSGSALSAPTRRGEFWIGVGVLAVVIALAAWWIGRDDSVGNKLANLPDSSRESVGTSVESTETPTTEDPVRPSDQPVGASITLAVLPFKNLGSPDDEYFSDGISDEIRGRLAKVRKLGVISRSSAFQYKDTDKTNRQIGSDLGVDYLIDGTIRWDKRGDGAGRVRITPELIRISDDRSMWSEPYDRQTEDIFEVQSDIAAQVLKQLQITLLEPERRGIEGKPTENSDAYHAYLRGVVYREQTDYFEAQFQLAIQMFERAISLDPKFALAHAQLSESHSAMHHFGYDATEHRARQAKAAVDRAFELQPDLPEAYVALGWYNYWCHRNYEPALVAFRTAQNDLPNSNEVLAGIGYILRRQGKFADAIGFLERAFKSNPLDSQIAANIGETYVYLQNYAEAATWFDVSISLAPDQSQAYADKAWLYWLWHADTESARAVLEELPGREDPISILAWCQQELLERNYRAVLNRLATTSIESLTSPRGFFPKDRLVGLAHRLLGNSKQSREAYEASRIILEEEVKTLPDDHRRRSSLGVVYAGLGRKQDAIREGKLGVELFPVSKDALIGPMREEDMALIYTMVGEFDLALDKLEFLLSIPSQTMSVPLLRLDPRWDALRDHPRYKSLMRKHGFANDPTPSSTAKHMASETTLAVLPFENVSDDPDTDYLSNEIPASIIDKMSGLSGLSVVSRSGAFRFDPEKEDASSFGRSLGASVILTGQLNARGQELTIRVELVDSATNRQIWSKRYPRELEDIVAVETDIARNISKALRIQLSVSEEADWAKATSVDPKSYRAYLEGRFWWNRRSAIGFERSLKHYDESITADPDYALAYAGKAATYAMMGLYSHPAQEVMPLAERAATRALELDPTLAEAYASLGWIEACYHNNWTRSEEYFKKALFYDPDHATAHHWYAGMLGALGRHDEAVHEANEALRLDPNSLIVNTELGWQAIYRRDLGRAQSILERVKSMDNSFSPARVGLGLTYLARQEFDLAVEEFREVRIVAPDNIRNEGYLGLALGLAGRKSEAMAELRRLEALAERRYVPHISFAHVFTGLGDLDQAFHHLDLSYQNRESSLLFASIGLVFDSIRQDPRFGQLVARLGLPAVVEPAITNPRESTQTRLAVLPFANLSGDPEQEYFSDGMTEEMITRLGRLRPDRLGVIARTSAMRYKNTDKLIDQIGRELGVDHVIEGGVRRAGGSVRINAQLIQVSDQTQIWGDSYTRDLSDVFAVQAEVAEAVAQALALELLPQDDLADEATPTANSAAYDAYLLGRSYWAKRTPDDIETAITHFKRAVQIDPDYALAHAGLADALNVLPWYKPIHCLPVIREAKEAAEKAIAINGRLAEAHAALGGVLFAFREYQESEGHFKTAIAIDPNNATAYQWYSELLSSLGRRLESIQLAREGVARDPQSPVVNLALANALSRARQYEDAIVQLRKIVQLDPDWIPARRIMAETLDHAGRHDEAALAFEECARLWEWKDVEVQGLKDAYRSRGMQGIYEVFYERQAQKGTEPQHQPQLGVLARLGKDDEALALLAQLVDDYEVASNWIGVNPYLDHLHGDPRFDELLRKVGLPKIEIPAASSMP